MLRHLSAWRVKLETDGATCPIQDIAPNIWDLTNGNKPGSCSVLRSSISGKSFVGLEVVECPIDNASNHEAGIMDKQMPVIDGLETTRVNRA